MAVVWNTSPRLMIDFQPISPGDMPQEIRDCLVVNVTVAGSRTVHAIGCYNPLDGEHRGDYSRLLAHMREGWTTPSGEQLTFDLDQVLLIGDLNTHQQDDIIESVPLARDGEPSLTLRTPWQPTHGGGNCLDVGFAGKALWCAGAIMQNPGSKDHAPIAMRVENTRRLPSGDRTD